VRSTRHRFNVTLRNVAVQCDVKHEQKPVTNTRYRISHLTNRIGELAAHEFVECWRNAQMSAIGVHTRQYPTQHTVTHCWK